MIDLTTIITILIGLFGAVITALLIPYIRSKTTAVQFDKFLTWVKIGVGAAEMIYTGLKRGVEKKQYVKDFLQRRGYTYDDDTVEAALEAAVNELKK